MPQGPKSLLDPQTSPTTRDGAFVLDTPNPHAAWGDVGMCLKRWKRVGIAASVAIGALPGHAMIAPAPAVSRDGLWLAVGLVEPLLCCLDPGLSESSFACLALQTTRLTSYQTRSTFRHA
ncbi:hypothetical protein J1614_006379 [Plenodomus biglobosus]|nr:hypothetical protein J1614_006379 [Plenodomus biglobosus]